MKIAHCTQFSALKGGVEQAVWTLSDYFVRAGHQVDVLSCDGQTPKNDKRSRRVRIKKIEIFAITKHSRLSSFAYHLGKTLCTPKLYELLSSRYASRQLQKRYLDHERYDIVFFHTQNLSYFRRVEGPPYVIVFHGHPFDITTRTIKAIIYKRFLRMLLHGKTIFVVSEGLRQAIIGHCHVNPNRIHCVGNPVDAERIEMLAAEEVSDKFAKPYIISVARLVNVKALDALIRAYAESAVEHQLVLLGDGPLRGKLQALVHTMGIESKVHFLGHRDNPFPYIKNADLLVLSSEEEGLGLVIVEAMICGTEVVATRTDGACEIMGEEAEDCLAPIGDHHALADKIRSALKTNQPVKPKLDRRFDAEQVAQTYLLYAQMTPKLDETTRERRMLRARRRSRSLKAKWLSLWCRTKLKVVYGLKLKKAPEKLNIIIKYPSRRRPELFKRCLSRWIDMLSFEHNVRFVLSFDDDDETMKTDSISAFIEEKRKRVSIDVYRNPQPQTKISAINANIESYQADMLIVCSDDMEPLVQGYDELMARYLFCHFPDGDGIINIRLSFNRDSWKQGVQVPVMGWKYYRRFNYVYYPEYISVGCPEEMQLVAEKLGRLAHINDPRVIIHNWYEVDDELRDHTISFDRADKTMFEKRKTENFKHY